jgi:hypothetical protein
VPVIVTGIFTVQASPAFSVTSFFTT